MKTSTEIASASKIVGEEKAIELIAKAGFDAWDFSIFLMHNYNYGTKKLDKSEHPLMKNSAIKFARKLKKIGLDNGIVCNQSHAPFPICFDFIKDSLKRAIECTYEAGGSICVIHPDNDRTPEENAQTFLELLPFAKSCGVKIALENMWNWRYLTRMPDFASCSTPNDFLANLNAINDDFAVACLDIGHAEFPTLETSAVEMIYALKDKLKTLHIHDNNKVRDSHQIPFSQSIDFVPIVKALKDINYSGEYFTLEAKNYLSAFNKENVFTGLKDLYNSVKKLVDIYDSL